MKRKGFVLGMVLAGCLGLSAQASGQDAGHALGYLHAQSWSTEDGAPQNSVHRILQTHDGYIWIATEGGVARFDGVSFRTFQHANEPAFVSDDTCCLAEDGTGDLWIGTADGLLRFDHGNFRRFSEADGLPSTAIEAVAGLPGQPVVVLAEGRLVQWKGDRFVAMDGTPAGLRGVEAAGGRLVWLRADGAAEFSGGGTLQMPEQSGQSASVEGISEDKAGTVWSFSTTRLTAARPGAIRTWRVGAELPGRRIESLYVDRDGRAWVGTNDGLFAVAATGAVTPIESLKGSSVLQTMQDREGDYWVGTDTSGLHLLRRLKFRTEPGLMTQVITAVVESDGMVWLGTRNDGLVRVSHGQVDEPAAIGALSSPIILSLATAGHGGVWAGTPDGLNYVSAEGLVRQISSEDGLPDDFIQALATGRSDSVWIGTRHGLVHLARLAGGPPKMEVITTRDGLPGDLVGALLVHGTDLYVATSGGLCRRAADGQLIRISQEGGASAGVVTAMAMDAEGRLWVAAQDGGLSQLEGGALHRVAGFSAAGMIDGMIADEAGYLWLRGSQGLKRVRLAELERCASVSGCRVVAERYGLADGLITEQLAASGSPLMARLADGELWFATRRGVAIANPAQMPFNSAVPPVLLQQFLVDETPYRIEDGPVVLGPGHVRYTMEFAALSFTQPARVRYRYRLEGLEKSWTDGGNRRSATYTNLPPGRFTFRVQAMNNDGVWNEVGASLQFRVVPAVYRRWWFYALCVLAMAMFAVFLYRLRLHRLQRNFDAVLEERNRVAREIHDTLAQDFVGVSLQLDIVSRLLAGGKVEAALQQVAGTRELVTGGLADARSSIWQLRANLAQDSLPTRLEKVARRYSDETWRVRLRVSGAYRAIAARVEEEVLRVAQESLSNVQRHSGATAASVELLYGEDMLVLTVEDTGRGFKLDEMSKLEGHYGLSGMQERAALCGGTLQIVSVPGEGTRVVLSVPAGGLKG